jgi:hypothetical protein
MRNNTIKIFIFVVVLLLTACSRQSDYYSETGYFTVSENTQEVPPRIEFTDEQPSESDVLYSEEIEEILEPAMPLVTEEGIVWLVPPTLEHDHISFCSQGGFIDSERRIICPVTGMLTGSWCGHGGGPHPFVFVYDPVYHLFGEPVISLGYGRDMIGMFPFDEALERFSLGSWHGLGGFNIVQAVDSTNRNYFDFYVQINRDERLQAWYLADDAYLGEFAVIYNGEFVTDFIFDGGLRLSRFKWFRVLQFDGIAMSLDGKWGIIDNYGNAIAPFIFDQINFFDNDRVIAVYNGRHGLIDRTGNILVPFLFDQIYHTGIGRNPYRIAAVYNGKHGVINDTGDIVIPFMFDHIVSIDYDTAFVMYNGRYGIVDLRQTEKNLPNPEPILPLNDWQEAFMIVLRGYIGREFTTVHDTQVEASFFLHDIDLDGVPELFVGDLFRFQTYLAIYRFYDGEAVSIDNNISSGYFGFWTNPEIAGFLSVDGWSGWSDETFFYLDEPMNINSVRFYRTFYDVNEIVQQYPFWQEIDGVRVTETEFEESFYRLTSSPYYWEPVTWHQIDEIIFREIMVAFN